MEDINITGINGETQVQRSQTGTVSIDLWGSDALRSTRIEPGPLCKIILDVVS